MQSQTASKFLVRGINEPAGRVVPFGDYCLLLSFPFNSFPDMLLCVFLTQRLRTATLGTRNDDGKIVFLAQFITQFPDVVIGLFAVVIFIVFDVVSSTKNDVIMDVSFINMGGNNIRIFSR